MSMLREAWATWREFWFKPADPLMLGVIRILTGMMLTYNLLIWGTDLQSFFGQQSLQPLNAIRAMYENEFVFSFLLYVPDAWLTTVHYGCVAVALLFCCGVGTRVTSLLAFLITISYSQRVPVANFGLDQILGMLCLYMAIGPSGASLSFDSWLLRRISAKHSARTSVAMLPSAQMVLRLIQIHVCIIYFWAGFAKLKGDSWWTGEAMWQVIANQEYQTIDLTWMAYVPWLPYLIAHVTVAWEVSFCILVWRPRWRPLMLGIGTLMHLGIGAFLGMWTFGLIMTFPYLAFAHPSRWRRRLALWPQEQEESAAVEDEAAVGPDLQHAEELPESQDRIDRAESVAAVVEEPEEVEAPAEAPVFIEEPVLQDNMSETGDQADGAVPTAVAVEISDTAQFAESSYAVQTFDSEAPTNASENTAESEESVIQPLAATAESTMPENDDTVNDSDESSSTLSVAEMLKSLPDPPVVIDLRTNGVPPSVPDEQVTSDGETIVHVMDDDNYVVGEAAPSNEDYIETDGDIAGPQIIEPVSNTATPSDETNSDGSSADELDTNHFNSGATMTNDANNTEGKNEISTSRMERIKPKSANSLTGAPPPQVDGKVEDSVLAPESEVLLVALHAPERNTFRTYLRRHDIPCRAAMSAENAVSIVLNMKPAAVLLSGSCMNPEEILTLIDDINDMVDAPILALLTLSQIKLLSNDALSAHVLQYPASLRQVREELTLILMEEGNAKPRCSLRTALSTED